MTVEASLPTPLSRCPELGREGVELWIKNDGLSHPIYGGNKVRKLVRLMAEAERRDARRLLTLGAVGSHHVLTSALFANAAGLRCVAVLIPQPATPHVVDTVRASLAQGVEPLCVQQPALAPLRFVAAFRPGDLAIPPGGSNVIGALAYADAVGELVQQLREANEREPDWIVVPVGSGGTCAGLAAGVVRHGLKTRVLGVQVVPGRAPRWVTRGLGQAVLRRLGLPTHELDRVLALDPSHVGDGYGHATASGEAATAVAWP